MEVAAATCVAGNTHERGDFEVIDNLFGDKVFGFIV